ncbi:hypothetical protein NBT05_09645 [Aquimarina sp. ERC-38]|uniref:hypothetical protein n=1 Tax=Aquimarina sp. ERC-38 TaxID=2949996 RepID=UPI00224855E1|nr:hypothetical protein [Aquimarina sp. ERC-38]UZO79234.1 hypothetical protein NBT05_09645 [Aquimarina sp. ERC-38]
MWFNFFKKIAFFIVFLLCLVSCQVEEEMMIEEEFAELVDSELLELLSKVVSDDDSEVIEVIDENCFVVKLPHDLLLLDGYEQVLIESKEQYDSIVELKGEDFVVWFYPIFIDESFTEGTEVLIFDEDELEAAEVSLCPRKDSIVSDNILCMDFMYPFDVKMFDTKRNSFKTLAMSHDEVVQQLVKDKKSWDRVSINYPIYLKCLRLDEIFKVTNNDELEEFLKSNENTCL